MLSRNSCLQNRTYDDSEYMKCLRPSAPLKRKASCLCSCTCCEDYFQTIKRICKETMNELYNEKQHERYSVFDGGTSLNYQKLLAEQKKLALERRRACKIPKTASMTKGGSQGGPQDGRQGGLQSTSSKSGGNKKDPTNQKLQLKNANRALDKNNSRSNRKGEGDTNMNSSSKTLDPKKSELKKLRQSEILKLKKSEQNSRSKKLDNKKSAQSSKFEKVIEIKNLTKAKRTSWKGDKKAKKSRTPRSRLDNYFTADYLRMRLESKDFKNNSDPCELAPPCCYVKESQPCVARRNNLRYVPCPPRHQTATFVYEHCAP